MKEKALILIVGGAINIAAVCHCRNPSSSRLIAMLRRILFGGIMRFLALNENCFQGSKIKRFSYCQLSLWAVAQSKFLSRCCPIAESQSRGGKGGGSISHFCKDTCLYFFMPSLINLDAC